MPFVKNTNRRLAVARHIGADTEDVDDDISYTTALKSAFRQNNEVGSLLSMEPGIYEGEEDKSFDPWEQMSEDEKLDDKFINHATFTVNKNQLNALRKQRDKERTDRRLLEDAGGTGVLANITAGIISPLNLLPIGELGLAAKSGRGVLKGGLVSASLAGATVTAQEAMLHASQLERTYGESALNISAATLLAGVLGAGFTKLSAKADAAPTIEIKPGLLAGEQELPVRAAQEAFNKQTLIKEVEESLDPEPIIAAGGDSVGAMKVVNDAIIKGRVARGLAKVLRWDPLARLYTSTEQDTRFIASRLAESPYAFEQGIAGASVETRAALYEGLYFRGIKISRNEFVKYKKGGGKLSEKEFNEAVSNELGDPDVTANQHIKTAANAWHQEVFEKLKKEAIDVKLFKENVHVTTAARYVSRLWDKGKVAAKLPQVIKVFSTHLKKTQGKELAEAGIDPDELASDIAALILGSPDGRLPYDYKIGDSTTNMMKKGIIKGPYATHQLKSPFMERTFDIPDKEVREFLERDIEKIAARNVKQMAIDIELTREFGDIQMGNQIDAIKKSWMAKMDAAKTEKERVKLAGKMKNELRDVAGIRDRLRGIYDVPDEYSFWGRAGRAVRDLNYLRLMGGVTPASFSDIARPFMAEGFVNAFKYGLKPLITNLKAFKVSANEAKEWNVALDTLLGGKAEIIADIGDFVQGGNMVERGLRAAAHQYSHINLLNYWTTGIKQLHAVVMQTRVSKMLLAGKYDWRLGNLGISKDNANNIAAQLRKHGVMEDGVYIANSKKWDSPELAVMWGAMLRKESNRVLMVPGQEKPLFMSTELGKTIFQFRSFTFSSLQRVLIAGIQGQDQNFMSGLIMMVSAGMMAAAFKNWDAGREQPEDMKGWVMEGIDYSGAMGLLMEANNTLEKMSSGNYGARPLLGIDIPATRFASRSQSEAILGPSFGSFLGTTLQIAGGMTDEKGWSASDTRAVRRLLPYQNLAIFRQGVDKIEESLQ